MNKFSYARTIWLVCIRHYLAAVHELKKQLLIETIFIAIWSPSFVMAGDSFVVLSFRKLTIPDA